MPLSFDYHLGNKNNYIGSRANFSVSSKSRAIFISIQEPTGEIGAPPEYEVIYNDTPIVTVRLNLEDISKLLCGLKNKNSSIVFQRGKHLFDFSLIRRENKPDAYMLKVSNDNNKFINLVAFPEYNLEILKEFLIFSLHRVFTAIHSLDSKAVRTKEKEKPKEDHVSLPNEEKTEDSKEETEESEEDIFPEF